MKYVQLTTAASIFRHWDFISSSLKAISEKSREPFDEEFVRKTLLYLATDPIHSWVGLTVDADNRPLAFGAAQECTPPFEPKRFFVIRWFYHTPNHFEATVLLMLAFETWAKNCGVSYYAITTRRSAGESIRCFSSARYGFKKAFLTFEKQIA